MTTTPQADAKLRDAIYDILEDNLDAKIDEGQAYLDGQEEVYEAIESLIKARDEQREREIQLKELRSFKDCFNDLQDAEEAMYIESNYIDPRITTLTQSSKGETK